MTILTLIISVWYSTGNETGRERVLLYEKHT
jgi:hypothetical protein